MENKATSKQQKGNILNNVSGGELSAPKVEIEIKRHQQLFALLSDPKRMWRVLLSLFLLIVVLFWGIACVVIAIKKYYPYNVVETNIQGATTMKTEDTEVTYWLFNTADLWANSGIEVEEGDILTIRASGASFTAIHHLVEASRDNYRSGDEWVGTEGQAKQDTRDRLRAEYRINKEYNEGILLMQIIPTDSSNNDVNWLSTHPNFLRDGNIEVIGKERRNLRISKSGTLHFAVNDIVLTDTVLKRMYAQNIDALADGIFIDRDKSKVHYIKKNDSDSLKEWFNCFFKEPSMFKKMMDYNERLRAWCSSNKINIDSIAKLGLALGPYPNVNKKGFPLVNELVYYRKESFINAWYVDNIGSFLIVIERKK